MGSRGFETDIIENWPLGVITSILADRLPDGAVPVARNAQFHNVGPQMMVFGTRDGCEVQNDDVADGAIVSQYFLNTSSDDFHLIVDDTGTLSALDAGTLTLIAASIFTDATSQFSWQTHNQFAYVVNGTDKFKTDGTDVFNMGIQQPADADWSVAAVGGGSDLPAGIYNLVITYFNSDTNHEGPQSELKSVTVAAGQKITVTLPDGPTIDDAQVDFIKIYIEQEDVRNDFFLVVDGATPSITDTSGWAVGTPTVDLDIPDVSLQVFKLLSPGVNNNYAPPQGAKFLVSHRSRLFTTEGSNLYWSPVDDPESFNLIDDTTPVGSGEEDGDAITGLAVLSDALIIFKRNAIYALVGVAPEDWQIVLLDKTVGTPSYYSIGNFDNTLFWMSLRGPQMLASVNSDVIDITTELIGTLFDETAITTSSLNNSVIIGHPVKHYVAWAVTPLGKSTNQRIIPFDYKMKRWMSDSWEMVDVKSCTLVNDSDGRAWPFVGDYDGWIYKVGSGDADGVPTGTSPQGTLTAATSTTLTDSTQTWGSDTLTGRYVYTWATANGVRSAIRSKITANTDTELTITPALDAIPDVMDNYSIGGILFDWRSAFKTGSGGFFRKRIEHTFVELASNTSGTSCDIEVYTDLELNNPVVSRTVFIGKGVGFDDDDALFDISVFAADGAEVKRIPIHTIGYSWQTRVIHMSAGEQLSVRRNGVQWQTKTKKPGI